MRKKQLNNSLEKNTMSYINNVSKATIENVNVEHLSTSSLLIVTIKTQKNQLEDEHEDRLYLDYDEAICLSAALSQFISYDDEQV